MHIDDDNETPLILDELPLMKAINPMQRQFVMAYHDRPNATQAAIKAGYSERTAKVQGSRLLSNVNIRKAINELENHLLAKQIISKTEAMKLLSDMARGRLSRFLGDNGQIDTSALKKSGVELQEYSITEGEESTTRKVKLRDPRAAIETLAKLAGWLKEEKVELGGFVFNLNLGGKE